jgi:beta-mannosidase
VTEFGFQAPATVQTMEECTLPEDRDPQSMVMEHHNKQIEGPERLMRFVSAHHRVETEWRRFTYLAQLVQAEALKTAVEHWRRRKFKTAGALFWQINDCWPVASWSVIDSGLRPKAGYFYAKRFFAPLLVSLRPAGPAVEVWVTNDLPRAARGTVNVSRRTFAGGVAWERECPVSVPANSSRREGGKISRERRTATFLRRPSTGSFRSRGSVRRPRVWRMVS